MATNDISDQPARSKPIVLIKPAEMRRRRGISRAQEYVLLKKGLLPQPVWQGSSRYYVEHELEEDTASLLAERNGGGEV
jgi:hypothetical protein